MSPAVGCLLSHTSVLREPHPAPGKAPPAPAQLPTTSTCLEQHPEKPWGAQTWLCCRKSRNKQILLATNKIQAMTTTTNNSKKSSFLISASGHKILLSWNSVKSAQPELGFFIKGRAGISQPRCFYKPEEERQKHRKKIIFLTSFQKRILFRFPLARLNLCCLSLHGFYQSPPSKSKPLISLCI